MKKEIVGLIGGTGLTQLSHLEISSTHQVATPYGSPSSDIQLGTIGKQHIAFLSRHGNPHSIAPHHINYRANISALQKMNASAIIAVNAVGGITGNALNTGAIVIPDNLIDYTWGREHSFFDGKSQPLQHIDFSYPYDEKWRLALIDAAKECGIDGLVTSATYGATQGPRLETAAEIQRMEKDGCSIVGMTGMPEASLAKELSIPYVSVCLVVNPAAGKSEGEITMESIHAVIDAGMLQIVQLLFKLFNAQ